MAGGVAHTLLVHLLVVAILMLALHMAHAVLAPDVTSAGGRGQRRFANNNIRMNSHYFQILGRCIRRYGHSCLGGHGKRSDWSLSEAPVETRAEDGPLLMDLVWTYIQTRAKQLTMDQQQQTA